MSNKSLFTVYSQRLAGFLMLNGFPLIKLTEGQSGRNNFIFVNTEMLQDCIDKWIMQKLKNNTQTEA